MNITDEEFKQSHAIGPVSYGRELCCGDILRSRGLKYVIGYNKKCAAYVLYVIDDGKPSEFMYETFSEVYPEWFEYIGNVHQHPHLLGE